MARNQYYYLVAGLPDLVLEQAKAPITVGAFRAELRERLPEADLELINLLFLPADHRNLLHLLRKGEGLVDPAATYSLAQLDEGLLEPELLRPYLGAFIRAFRNDEPLEPGMSWENQLTSLYYDYVLSRTEGFLHTWFAFERDLKNVLAATAARRHSWPLDGQLIGHYPLTEAIRKSHTRDFGLTNELPYLDKLLQIEEQTGLLKREQAIDQLKWDYLEELNTFNYFTIEAILGFILRLAMVERWVGLDPERGRSRFKQRVRTLEHHYEFPNEFSIS